MALRKYENFSGEYILNGESIDLMAAKVEEFLYSLGMDRAQRSGHQTLHGRGAAFRWYDHYSAKGEEPKVSFYSGKTFFEAGNKHRTGRGRRGRSSAVS